MRKFLLSFLVLGLVLFGGFVSSVRADVPNISVRVEQPQSPTNQNNFTVTFVVLDRLGRTLTAQCLKSGPGEGGVYSQYGSDIGLLAGGNSEKCQVNSGVVTSEGTYNFKVKAIASGGETMESSFVSVEYKPGGPGTPNSYSKDHPSSCQYVIKFHTADDGGKTSRVNIYRSDSLSFSIDGTTQVGTVWIGSNMDGSFTNDVPDCNKNWYFAVRAFDGAGNGSAVVGDSQTTTILGSPAPTSGAIALPGRTGGSVLGEDTGVGTEGGILGAEASPGATATSPEATEGLGSVLGGMTGWQKLGVAAGIIGIIILGLYLRRRSA